MTHTPYEDLVGSITADITDSTTTNMLSDLAENFGIDTDRYDPVGINIYGTENLFVSFVCIDKSKSLGEEHIVAIRVEDEDGIEFSDLFKNMGIELVLKYYEKYADIEIDEEITLDNEDGGE